MDIRRVLVTGGSGLVGRTLSPLLDEYEVTHFDRVDPRDGNPFIMGDLSDGDSVAAACEGHDAILHIAALHGRTWNEAGDGGGFRVNVNGTWNVLEGALRAGVRRVVFTSSIWAVGHGADPPYLPIDESLPRDPAELYGLTKILGESMCRYYSSLHGLSTIVIRPGYIAPAERHSPDNMMYLAGLVDVRDVAMAHLQGLRAPADMLHEVFIITADSPLCRLKDPSFYLDNPRGALLELFPSIRDREDLLAAPPAVEWYSIEKARRLLGYSPMYNFSPSQEKV